MGYLDRLKALDAGICQPKVLQELQEPPSCSSYSGQGEHFSEIEAANDTPIPTETLKAARDCSTCAHVCRSGCCGEPVAAGLSDLPGVIRYGNADKCETFEERAAIMEYDGGLSREEAEREAARALGNEHGQG